jgi:putative peptide zinc metalloprotease protein
MSEPFLSSSWHRVSELVPRLRAHSEVSRHRYRSRSWYVIADPASGRVYRFTPAAYAFIRAMDGSTPIGAIWARMASSLDDNAPTQDEIIRLLYQLHEADMLQMDRLPDAEQLSRLVSRQSYMQLKTTLKNPISISIPLWDPDAFLTRTVHLVRPLFGWLGIVLWMALVGSAAVMAALYHAQLASNIDDRILGAENLLLMAMVYPVVKALHELGHAYAVKVYGGEVHRLGVMLIAFFPVPYVDATASAVLRSKYQRAVVGAAGMIVELALAAIALFVWLTVEPGIARAAAFNVMVITGISTIIVNGNPLLRFDAYYILNDLAEMPNLATRSTAFWRHLWDRYVFGTATDDQDSSGPGERLWFLLYAPLSFLYRMMVLVGLALIVASEYFIVGVLIALVAMYSSIVLPLARALRRVVTNARIQTSRRRTAAVLIGGCTALTLGLSAVPVPMHTNTEGTIWLPKESYVRARAEGFVQRLLREPGERVNAGDALVASTDPFLDIEIRLRELRIRELEARHQSEQFADRVQAEITRKELEEARSRLESDLDRSSRLQSVSETDGVFAAPRAADLPGRFFKRGEIIGYVLPEKARIIRVVVTQADIDLVRQRLRRIFVKLADAPETTLHAISMREVPAAGDELPSLALSTAGGGTIAVDPRDPNGLRTLSRIFQLDIALDDDLVVPAFGARTYVRFEHDWEPVAIQAYRKIRQLFLSYFNA